MMASRISRKVQLRDAIGRSRIGSGKISLALVRGFGVASFLRLRFPFSPPPLPSSTPAELPARHLFDQTSHPFYIYARAISPFSRHHPVTATATDRQDAQGAQPHPDPAPPGLPRILGGVRARGAARRAATGGPAAAARAPAFRRPVRAVARRGARGPRSAARVPGRRPGA